MAPVILIIEDEKAIAETLVYALKTEGFAPSCCDCGRDGIRSARERPPALVILDVGLPDCSGFEVLKKIREFSQVPVLFLTARAEEVDRILGLELGADDYVPKPFSPREVAARVKAILRRKAPAAPSSLRSANFTIEPEKLLATYCGQKLELSRYEFRILQALAASPGRVFSREQLMHRAWEEPEMSLERTVDTHIKTLRAKLRKIKPDAEPIKTHRGSGYSFEDGDGGSAPGS